MWRKFPRMTFVISSCSWGAGEWGTDTGGQYKLLHGGVVQYLCDNGYDAINLSVPGGDPMGMLWSLQAFMQCNQHKCLDIYVIQSDIGRSMQWCDTSEDIPVYDLIDRLYYEYYRSLDQAAKKYNLSIKLIGGLTDITVDVSDFTNLEILAHSWCQMIDRSLAPVKLVDEVGITFLEKNKGHRKSEILSLVEQALARREFWKSRPDMFYPDFQHPNRSMHQQLCNFILENLD